MAGDAEWKALFAAVDANLPAIRAADVIVLDLRGNGGGDSSLGLDLARRLYGDLFAHVVKWQGDLYLEDGLHRAVRAALQQRQVLHARVLEMD